MPTRTALLLAILLATATCANAAEPIKALMIAGGCCHDYTNQKDILARGISARANIEWTIVHDPAADKTRTFQIPIYKKADWIKGYDVVLHNECLGGVKDNEFLESITKAHAESGVGAVMIHCSLHSYRAAKTDEWRKLLGLSSYNHERHHPITVKLKQTGHPILTGLADGWKTPQGELYRIVKVWDDATVLATGQASEKKDHPCIWVNEYGKAKVFGTSLGHHNETQQTEEFLNFVARGLLWTCDKLGKDGEPVDGYGPKN